MDILAKKWIFSKNAFLALVMTHCNDKTVERVCLVVSRVFYYMMPDTTSVKVGFLNRKNFFYFDSFFIFSLMIHNDNIIKIITSVTHSLVQNAFELTFGPLLAHFSPLGLK